MFHGSRNDVPIYSSSSMKLCRLALQAYAMQTQSVFAAARKRLWWRSGCAFTVLQYTVAFLGVSYALNFFTIINRFKIYIVYFW